jgi:hypothetical protein
VRHGETRPAASRIALSAYLAAALTAGWAPAARAQVEATPPPTPPVTSQLRRTPQERDRFELGVAVPDGAFDFLGTFAYRRLLRERSPFEQSIQIEVAGGHKDYLTEGSLSLYYFFRPMKSYKEGWRIRPLIELGPGAHVVVQSADLIGFSKSAFHSKGYLKTHLYAGAEFLLTNKFGFLIRGRMSVPDHHPLDYAQAAIFLR